MKRSKESQEPKAKCRELENSPSIINHQPSTYYSTELKAIKRANRYRNRVVFYEKLRDFASNDYLGLSKKKKLLKRACKRVKRYKFHSPKASTLVNGYHPIHKEFEEYIAKLNGFDKALCVGSGFLANLSIFEALPRRGDLLLFDEEFHASGLLASTLNEAKVIKFLHNDSKDLEKKIKEYKSTQNGRVIIGVEGVYSMSGEVINPKIFSIADSYNALLVIDEAHSVGVLGKNLLGVFEYFDIKPKANHIKMGTLGKALGSYGAYILSSNEIYDFLCNRAKAVIYATAPSVFDIALAYEGFLYIQKNIKKYKKFIKKRKQEIKKVLNKKIKSLILTIEVENSSFALEIKEKLLQNGFLVGAIRPPTVKKPILRIIPRIGEKRFTQLLKLIRSES